MSILAFLVVLFLSTAALLLILGRRHEVPTDPSDWNRRLAQDARRLLGALELRTQSDSAIAHDALRRAVRARDRSDFGEALRLVDLVADVVLPAIEDRAARLRGLGLFVRMASAVSPIPALLPQGVRVWSTRALFAAGAVIHHMLVSTVERLYLRIQVLQFGYRLTRRAFVRGHARVTRTPQELRAWAEMGAPVEDMTGILDPLHIESVRAYATAHVGQRA